MAPRPNFQVLSYNSASGIQVGEYKRRKFHRKASSGCSACKSKRVKCDELRPTCARCRRNGRPCLYSSDPMPLIAQENMSLGVVRRSSVQSPLISVPFPIPETPKTGTPIFSLMHHFLTHWTHIFHIPFHNDVLSLSKSNPLIRSTILAIAACHLRHVSPGVLQHRIAEHVQQSSALREFQKVLDTPREYMRQSDVDTLFLGAMLLNMIAFALPESEAVLDGPAAMSMVCSLHEDNMNWLNLQAGFRPLLLSFDAYIEKTMNFIGAIFFDDEMIGVQWNFTQLSNDLDGIPHRWVRVFELDGVGSGCDADGDTPSAIFRAPVTFLAYMKDVETTRCNMFKVVAFPAKMQDGFRTLLSERDERALWLLAYWLGILCRYQGVWWCQRRARRDYTAICLYLEEVQVANKPDGEGKLWREMMKELNEASLDTGRV